MADDILTQTAAVKAALSTARQSSSGTDYELLEQHVSSLEAMAREAVQSVLSAQYKAIVEKLEGDDLLSDEELQWLELIIVGEAEQPLTHEAEVAAWEQELEALVAELNPAAGAGADWVESLLQLQGLCREAVPLVNRIAFFYREKERVESFQNARSAELTPEARQLLADVIRAMMTSDTM
jgi:hypothetical protein